MTSTFQVGTLALGHPSVFKSVDAAKIVNRLLEQEEPEDPKDFLARNDIGVRATFRAHGWRLVKSIADCDEFNKIEDNLEYTVYVLMSQGCKCYVAYFAGRKRFEGEHHGIPWRRCQEFDINGEIDQKPGQSDNDFVAEVEDYLSSKTGPEEFNPNEPVL